ncbi:MAG: ribonuclease P protein component [Candidatus Bipolaricaulia bacterium]
MSDNRFPKENRLVREAEFSRVYDNGFRFDGGSFVFYLLDKDDSNPRIGIVTPKYVGTAVKRNRVKRLIRESFRKNKDTFNGLDLIVRPKENAAGLTNDELVERFLTDFRSSRERFCPSDK